MHGSRVASATAQGDSVRLVLNEVDAPARTLATFPFKGQRPVINSLTWSRGGAEIAVSISSEGSPAGLSVFAIPSDRSKPVTRRDLHVSHSYCCDGIQWLPDDNAVLAIAGGSGDDAALVLFPLRNGEPPRVIAADVTSWESILSPDGKHAVYQRTRTATSTIWSASFKGLVTP